MAKRPTVKRRRLEESPDEDAPVDESRASIPSDDGGTQGSQTLEESSEILGESQYDDGIHDAEDDYRFIQYGREEQRVEAMISNGQIIFRPRNWRSLLSASRTRTLFYSI